MLLAPDRRSRLLSDESGSEEVSGAMIIDALAGIGVGTLRSTREITPSTASVVDFASRGGGWFGVAEGRC